MLARLRRAVAFALVLAAGAAAAGPGDGGLLCLDPSFADGGVFVRDVDGVDNVNWTPQGLDLQSDGKLVIAGSGGASPRFDFVALRLLEDGSLDQGFGDGGLTELDFGATFQSCETVRVQPGGAIILGGSKKNVLPDGGLDAISIGIARLLPNGTPDPAFGSGGLLKPRFGNGAFQLVNAQALLPDGRLRFGGQGSPGDSGINLLAIGLLVDGGADPSFGDGGLVEVDFSRNDEFGGVLTLDSLDRLLLPGTTYSSGFDFGLARLLPSGQYDPTFTDDAGRAGRVTTDFFGKHDACAVVIVQPDGRIVCGGDAETADGGTRFALARYLSTGALDPTFGPGGGKLSLDFGAKSGIQALVLLPDLTLVAGGYATNTAGDTDFMLAFLDPTGALDGRYGNAGTLRFDVTPGRDDGVHTLRLDARGRLLIYGETTAATSNDFAVMRLGPCTPPDAGPPDAGPADAGALDAGTPDAGVPGAGTGPRHLQVGCDCQAVSPGEGAMLVFALALVARLRRR